jgi:uncharacterized membrane protein YqjE
LKLDYPIRSRPNAKPQLGLAFTDRGKSTTDDRSVADLINDLTEQLKRLVRDEFRLAVFELQRKRKRLKFGMGTATVASLLGAATVVAAAVLALALVVPGWLSALIIGVGLLLFAGLAALVGRKQIKRATPRSPKRLSTESGKTWTRCTPSASLGAPLLGVSGETG